jgi:hypothetical protein
MKLCAARGIARSHDGAENLGLACHVGKAIAQVGIKPGIEMIFPENSFDGRELSHSPSVVVIGVSEEKEEVGRGFITHEIVE